MSGFHQFPPLRWYATLDLLTGIKNSKTESITQEGAWESRNRKSKNQRWWGFNIIQQYKKNIQKIGKKIALNSKFLLSAQMFGWTSFNFKATV